MSDLAGKAVLVTGGGSGIGLATARLLVKAGARVAIAGRDEAKLRRAAESLNGGDRLIFRAADVSDAEQTKTLVEFVTRSFGRIDILVNNAGLNIKQRKVRELTVESWRQLQSGNLDSAFYCIHAVLPSMLERKGGLIINICSIAGKRANPLGGGAYAAAKSGMKALGSCLAAEERENGIRVSNIYPGEVETPILEQRPQPVSAEQRKVILQPEDVAEAVLFVATLPPRASVPELVIKPTAHVYV